MSKPTEDDAQFDQRVQAAMQSKVNNLERRFDELQTFVLDLTRIVRRLSDRMVEDQQ